jgi:hypothetical protein
MGQLFHLFLLLHHTFPNLHFTSRFIFMVFIIWFLAIFFGIYMLQRNARRSAARHERAKEKYDRLLDQIRKSQYTQAATGEEDSHTQT